MARRILGLDLGSHAVKAVEFRQTLRGVEVAQLRSLPLDDPSPALASELRDFIQMHDLPTEHVVVSLAGDRVSTRRLSFPFRDRRKIGPAVPFEVEAQVPFDLRRLLRRLGDHRPAGGAHRRDGDTGAALRGRAAPRYDPGRRDQSPNRGGGGAGAGEPGLDLRARGNPAAGGYRPPQDDAVPVRERAGGRRPHRPHRRSGDHRGPGERARDRRGGGGREQDRRGQSSGAPAARNPPPASPSWSSSPGRWCARSAPWRPPREPARSRP